MKFKLLRAHQQYREELAFVVYLLLIVALAPLVAGLIGDAWEASQLIKPLTETATLAGLSADVVILGGLGLFVGLLGLMTVDKKKRWTALLLWIGFGIIAYQLASAGQLIPEISGVDQIMWLLPGALIGITIGGGLGAVRLRSLGPTEFRRGTKSVYILFALIVLVSLLELHISYPSLLEVSDQTLSIQIPPDPSVGLISDGLAVNAAIGIAAIATVRQFVRYDSGEDFFIIGPPSSGKSLLLIGCYLEALKRDADKNIRQRESLDPSQDLMELVENLDRDASEWIVEATGRSELRDLRFKYIRGSIFPKNVTISSVDYAGEHLRRIPASLAGEIDEPDQELTLITDGIQDASTLILLVDIERHLNNEGLGLAEYFRILEEAEDKGVVIVATKCDILADQFWDENELNPQQHFGEFRQYVEDNLCQSEQFSTLLRQTPDSEIHPVFYETEFNEEGERVPVRDDSGSVVTVGFNRLLSRLGK